MADYNSDRTGSNIDAVLDKADNLTQAAVGVGGNVGIGTASPSAKLDVAGGDIRLNSDSSAASGSKSLQFWRDNNERGRIKFDFSNSSLDIQADGVMAFKTAGENERARIDSSGNLLVGTTSTSVGYGSTDAGIALRGKSGSLFSRDNSFAISANRNGNDGDIMEFRKDGETVGSIGTYASQTYIGSDDIAGLIFHKDPSFIGPKDPSSITALDDGNISLGWTNQRFKDLYLSGGVYLGGTGAANKLDDYETGAFTPTLTASTTSDFNYAANDGHYVKIGDLVYFTVAISLSSKGTSSGNIELVGLPFIQADILSGTSIESGLTFSYWSSITVQALIGYVNGSSSSCILRKILSGNTGATEDAITTSDIGNAFSFRVQGTYIAQ